MIRIVFSMVDDPQQVQLLQFADREVQMIHRNSKLEQIPRSELLNCRKNNSVILT